MGGVAGWILPILLSQAAWAAVPTVSVTGLAFTDLDLDTGDLGGTAQWSEPADTTTVTYYAAGLATDTSGSGLSTFGGSITVGTNQVSLAADTSKGSFTHLVVYTANGDGYQATPVSLSLVDASASVSSVSLTDKDLDANEIGGDITWTAGVTTNVADYKVYLSTNSIGASKTQLGAAVTVGTNILAQAADLAFGLYTNIVVYTRSSLAEQTTPASFTISDSDASASSVLFVDKDLDSGELGGEATWSAPTDAANVATYEAYWSQDALGTIKSSVASVAVGTNSASVAAETAITTQTHLVVYTKSALAEQTTPASHTLLDKTADVSSLTFLDTDLDASQIGGDITWIAPLDTSQVTHYSVYFADSAAGVGAVQQGSDIQVATNQPTVAMDTAKTKDYITVYTKSSLVEQTTPVGLLIADVSGNVLSLSLADEDLDATQLGGTITWSPPADTSQLVHYNVYFATDAAGTGKSSLGVVALNTNALALAADTDKASWTHIVVYSDSGVEQTTPSSFAIDDTTSSVGSLAFTDKDLDATELVGEVTWAAPGDTAQVSLYRAYFATDSAGAGKSRINTDTDNAYGTNVVTLPDNTAAASWTDVVVYTVSSLAEQTTPVAVSITDVAQSASNVQFTDLDLDTAELGGTVQWDEPGSIAPVSYYSVYFATSAAGAGRSLLSGSVAVGTNTYSLAAETALGSYTHAVVYTKSSWTEQSTPAALTLVDTVTAVSGIAFTDLDLDEGDLGGDVTWNAATDTSQASHYKLYLAEGATSGVARSQLDANIAIGTNAVTLLADTPLGSYTHFVVHLLSSLAEMTTPAGTAAISDAYTPVLSLTFGDRDFDIGQIGGIISWSPPSDVSQVLNYAVYTATDAAGTGPVQVGSTVAVGTNSVTMPISTSLGSFTHVVVFAKSSLDFQTTPTAVVIADTPVISTSTSWTISNAVATTPVQNGLATTLQTGLEWSVKELRLYSDSACTTQLSGTALSSGQKGQYHGPDSAFDDDIDTEWRSQCAECSPLEASLGMSVLSVVLCVRWLQAPVRSGRGVRSIVFQIGGEELARAQNLKGGDWEGLSYSADGGGWVRL